MVPLPVPPGQAASQAGYGILRDQVHRGAHLAFQGAQRHQVEVPVARHQAYGVAVAVVLDSPTKYRS